MKILRTVLEGIFDEKWTMSNTSSKAKSAGLDKELKNFDEVVKALAKFFDVEPTIEKRKESWSCRGGSIRKAINNRDVATFTVYDKDFCNGDRAFAILKVANQRGFASIYAQLNPEETSWSWSDKGQFWCDYYYNGPFDEFVSKKTGSDNNFWHAKRTACWLKHMIEK